MILLPSVSYFSSSSFQMGLNPAILKLQSMKVMSFVLFSANKKRLNAQFLNSMFPCVPSIITEHANVIFSITMFLHPKPPPSRVNTPLSEEPEWSSVRERCPIMAQSENE